MKQVTDPTVELPLPLHPYSVQLKEFKFEIQPLSENSRNLLQRIMKLGGSVTLIPEERPTSIFVSCNVPCTFKQYNYEVSDSELKAHLYLIGAREGEVEERLENFIDGLHHLSFNDEPKKYARLSQKMLRVKNVYEF
jgi:hypothetical protein